WVYSACLCLRSAGNNSNVLAFTTPIRATNWNTAAIFCSKAAGNWTRSIKGSLTARADCWTCPDSKPSSFANGVHAKLKHVTGDWRKIIDRSVYDLTVFKLHFGKLTLKMYDKGDRVLRVEIIVNNIEELRCGKRLEKLPGMLERLQAMVVAFLGVVQAAHL